MSEKIIPLREAERRQREQQQPEAEGNFAGKHPLILAPDAPLGSAKEFVSRRHSDDTCKRTILHHRGSFHAWTGTHYPEADDAALRAQLYGFLDEAKQIVDKPLPHEEPFDPTRFKVNDVIDALKAIANIPASTPVPSWLGDIPTDLPASEIIAVSNGLLHLPTRTLLQHTPDFYTHNSLPFAYDPNAPAPTEWLRFLDTLWNGNTEAERAEAVELVATLQEIFGYCLTDDTRLQKAFLLVGPKRSGKGTIARVLTHLLGRENVAGPTLASLGQNFGLAPLIGRRIAVISDARLGNKSDQHFIAERLLAVTGEDSITVDRKYREAWTGRLTARFIVISNELPRLSDASGALASRFIILLTRRSFYGREDHKLEAKLMVELPGVLNWAIDGWERLMDRGYFLPPTSSQEAMQELEDLASPIGAFLRDICEIGPAFDCEVGRLFDAWRSWCLTQGRDRPGTAQTFGKDLRAAIPSLKVIRPRECGERLRYYQGVRLK
jgi:putative DNA primase/helicase